MTAATDLDPMQSPSGSTLRVEDVVKDFRVRVNWRTETLRAVDAVAFTCGTAETVGIVGESGSGKTTLGRLIAGTVAPTSGVVNVSHDGHSDGAGGSTRVADRKVQMVYQNPAESLDPRWRVARSVAEPLIGKSRAEREAAVSEALALVGLQAHLGTRYPHQLSGGQQQRICIARAIIAEPTIVVLDEAISGLDVVLQGEILNLLQAVQERTGVTYLFISHDLAAVSRISSRILVMYLGRVIESVPDSRLDGLLHPYSVALRSAQLEPGANGERRQPIVLRGEPSAMRRGGGCRFAPRCPLADDRCRAEDPPLTEHGDGRLVACYHPGELTGD